MIKWLYSLIPWERNMQSNRQAVALFIQLEKKYSVSADFRSALKELLKKIDFNEFLEGEDKTYLQKLLQQEAKIDYSSLYFDLLITGSRIKRSSSYRYLGWMSEQNAKSDSVLLKCPFHELTIDSVRNFIDQLDPAQFHLGFFYDADYVGWQSRTSLSMYKYTGGLKFTGTRPSKRVDISDRPGRSVQIPGHRGGFQSGAAHFWFGELIFPYFPRERILSFPHAERIEELPNGIIHLHLYEGIFDGDKPENQRRQHLLRQHLGIGAGI